MFHDMILPFDLRGEFRPECVKMPELMMNMDLLMLKILGDMDELG